MRTFDAAFRLAIWDVWDHKCAWCGNPLDLEDLEVEHLIARGLNGKQRRKELARHGLDEDYDLDSTGNLAPAHRRPCNANKSMKPLPDSPRIDQLRTDANDRAPKVERAAERHRKATKLTQAAAIIEAADPALVTKAQLAQLTKATAVISAHLGLGHDVQVHPSVHPHDFVYPEVTEAGSIFGTERMKQLIDEWGEYNDDLLDEVVADGFDAHGQELEASSLHEVHRIGFVEDLDMFLVRATFDVSYMYYDNDMNSGLADTDLVIDLWVSLDDNRTEVLEISVDHFEILPDLK